MLCSTIIPTICRPSLSIAIQSVMDQGLEPGDFEIIIVNDSGKPLPRAGWQELDNIKIIDTNRRNRSVARNVGAAASQGKYLHFLDDDDWMMPGALDALLSVAETTNAAWVHGAFRMVDNSGEKVAEIFPDETGNCCLQMMAWEWLPIQASLISSSAFFEVDGFASLPSLGGMLTSRGAVSSRRRADGHGRPRRTAGSRPPCHRRRWSADDPRAWPG